MVYIRGNRGDYDHWRDLGNGGWSYEDVLPCFVRMESNQRFQDQCHGSTGPITVSDHSERNPLSDIFVEAAKEIGIQPNSDFNGAVGLRLLSDDVQGEREVQRGGWVSEADPRP
jgi:choline dehydrogenase